MKGFTLLEFMAVVVVLAMFSLVSRLLISSSVEQAHFEADVGMMQSLAGSAELVRIIIIDGGFFSVGDNNAVLAGNVKTDILGEALDRYGVNYNNIASESGSEMKNWWGYPYEVSIGNISGSGVGSRFAVVKMFVPFKTKANYAKASDKTVGAVSGTEVLVQYVNPFSASTVLNNAKSLKGFVLSAPVE